MNGTDRRQFLQMAGAGVVAGALGSTINKALAIPANNRTGTINDVEHVVILMQENRPFDHHFGTLRGVRGFRGSARGQDQLPASIRRTRQGVGIPAAGGCGQHRRRVQRSGKLW